MKKTGQRATPLTGPVFLILAGTPIMLRENSRHGNSVDSIRWYAEELEMRNDPAEISAVNDAIWDVILEHELNRRRRPIVGRRDSGVISRDLALRLASGAWRAES
jgi:hypothetical protein